jgi:RsiW-degrading membrane proteinase PrsW (M82 family)
MSAVGNMWRTDRWRLIGLAGIGVAFASILMNLGFFFRPGTSEVLGGLSHHAFVLGLMLVLTSGSRTVSLGTLVAFWLLGLWGVFGLTYVLQSQVVSISGADIDGEFVSVWLAPFSEEALKLAPVAIFLLLAARGGYRHPSMSDGLLLGFMVGAGVTFQEDAHYGEILGSGDAWGAAKPWTAVFPTITPIDSYFALNHALWAALSGLTIGAAVMLRHWRWTWPIALAGPVLSVSNHLMANHFASTEFGTSFLLRRVSGGGVPWFYQTVRDLTDGGRVLMLVLIAGAVAVVVAEGSILRWVTKRDRMFPALSSAHIFGLLARITTRAGAAQVLAANQYTLLRRSVYFAGWRTKLAGGNPVVTDADLAALGRLYAHARAPARVQPPPTLAAAPEAGATTVPGP